MLAWGETVSRQRLLRGKGFVVEGYMAHVMNGRKLNLAATQSPGAEGHIHEGLQRTSGIRGFSAALYEHFGGKR